MEGRSRVMSVLSLVALPSAVGCARAFAASILPQWGATSVVDDAMVIVSELVTNAVTATGVLTLVPAWSELAAVNLITVRLVACGESIVIEVRDVCPKPPVLAEQHDDAEGGRGLVLVQALSSRWGYFPVSRGKITWAELAIKPDRD